MVPAPCATTTFRLAAARLSSLLDSVLGHRLASRNSIFSLRTPKTCGCNRIRFLVCAVLHTPFGIPPASIKSIGWLTRIHEVANETSKHFSDEHDGDRIWCSAVVGEFCARSRD